MINDEYGISTSLLARQTLSPWVILFPFEKRPRLLLLLMSVSEQLGVQWPVASLIMSVLGGG